VVFTIIGEEVVELEPKPLEYTIDKEDIDGSGKLLTVYPKDFVEILKTINHDLYLGLNDVCCCFVVLYKKVPGMFFLFFC